jgi:hypothetical protein
MSRLPIFLAICLFASVRVVARLLLPGLANAIDLLLARHRTDLLLWNVSIERRNLGEWRLCERATLGTMGHLSTPVDYLSQTSLAC